jgi:hypothetical protein
MQQDGIEMSFETSKKVAPSVHPSPIVHLLKTDVILLKETHTSYTDGNVSEASIFGL